jgi:hypothetical protein
MAKTYDCKFCDVAGSHIFLVTCFYLAWCSSVDPFPYRRKQTVDRRETFPFVIPAGGRNNDYLESYWL